jgi:hypothetical protein
MRPLELVYTHLPNSVVAASIFTFYNIHTGETTEPIAIGSDFVVYFVAIFIGFVFITPILNRVFDRSRA